MSNKGLSKETREQHESYGMVGINRVSTSGTYLFGSIMKHHSYVQLEVKRASRTRHLAGDWYHAESRDLIRVKISHTDWGIMLSSPGIGDGVPCTLDYVDGEEMADCPEPENMPSKFSGDLKATTRATVAELVALRNQLNQSLLPGNKPLNKTEQKELLEKINSAIASIEDSIPFIEKSFGEEMEEQTNKAIGELEAIAAHMIHKTGLNALAKANQMLDAEKTLPEFPRDIRPLTDKERLHLRKFYRRAYKAG